MTELTVRPSRAGLAGRVKVPGDKSISHRALLLAALGKGESELRGLSTGADVAHTAKAIANFGAEVRGVAPGLVRVLGGRERLHEPAEVINVGNSGTGIRLLTGWAATIHGMTVMEGDGSIAQRPMGRVVEPLRKMGARIDGRQNGSLPPLVVHGGRLSGIDYTPPVASAQVKTAVLLAGLGADGTTTVREPLPTRAHTEEMLALAGAEISSSAGKVSVRRSTLSPLRLEIPGDPSQAAFWIVAACITPGSDVVVENVYVGPGRAAFVDALRRMGADISYEAEKGPTRTADIRVRYQQLQATEIHGREVPALIDEIPALAVAAASAKGTTVFRDAAELAVKESNRIATTCSELKGIGATALPRDDGLEVKGTGGKPLRGGQVQSHGDHRIAMSMAVAGLAAASPVRITGWQSVATSYPGFEEVLARWQ